jgi:hypothetical protein
MISDLDIALYALESQGAVSEAEPQWKGWAWKPTETELSDYAGVYHSDLYGDLEIRRDPTGLIASLGAMRRQLRPAAPGLFGARRADFEAWEPVPFAGPQSPQFTRVEFDGKPFERAATTH